MTKARNNTVFKNDCMHFYTTTLIYIFTKKKRMKC